MTYEQYRAEHFTEPRPKPRFRASFSGAVLYFREFDEAVAYYTAVLGPPGYVEGEGTRGWFLGGTTLTILKAGEGSPVAPANTELSIQAADPREVDRMQLAFLAAGGRGPEPIDTMMYYPVRYATVTDPFGTVVTIIARLDPSQRES